MARQRRYLAGSVVARALKNSQLIRQPPDEKHAYFGDRARAFLNKHGALLDEKYLSD
jgi:hypothetical protein